MKDQRTFAAGIGFAFVAAWIAFSFGEALLCLLGAAAFWAVAGVLAGSVDLGELQGRFTGRSEEDLPTTPGRPKTSGRARVR
ncbi:MAG TPA: hypothetical protein VGC32_03325 [Solirubrobacterales bacterium]